MALPIYGTLPKFTWRMVAVVLAAESVLIFFGALVAWSLAAVGADKDRATTYLVVGSALAVLALVAAGSMRRPFGITLAWIVQVCALLAGFIVSAMVIVGGLFFALFLVCLVQGRRIDAVQAAREQAAGEQPQPQT